MVRRSAVLTFAGTCIFAIYKIFSKAGYLSFAAWIIVWTVSRKMYLTFAVAACIGLMLLIVTPLKLADEIQTVYSAEIGGLTGKLKTEQTLAGRWHGWQNVMNRWLESPFYMKIIGDGDTHTGVHNDFLRALFSTGIVGFILYITTLSASLFIAARNCMRSNTPLNTMALMLLVMWVVDAIGLVPSACPGYQIYVWGFVGLAFEGVKGLDEAAAPTDRAAEARTLGYAKA
jgi:O-antigen ligase